MKKRLCLFMIALLLLVSTGCSRTTPQIPDGSVTGSTGSTATLTSISSDSHTTEDSSVAADSAEDSSNDTKEESMSDSSVADPDSETLGAADENSATDQSATGSNGAEDDASILPEEGVYTSKEDVALYIHLYGHLPPNFITKKEAEELGWKGGSLEPYAPGMCIGGSRFGNYEELLPQADGRSYTECDIDTLGADKRGAKRIVFSNDGLIYYTEDHYKSFELLYGDADP